MCIICLSLDKMDFNTAYNELQKIPEGFDHRKEVEKLIKEKFKGSKETIRLETLRELAIKYKMKRK